MKRNVLKVSTVCVLAALASPTWAQSPAAAWPSQTVRLIVAYPAGGGVDVFARATAQSLTAIWKKPVVVENRPGANTLIAAEAVARATDGHTLLLTTDSTHTVNPHLYSKLPYDATKDFVPITMMVSFDQMLVATPKLPANNLAELIKLAKAEPNKYSYASFGSGSQPHLATEMLKRKAGIEILHVPYRGLPQALNAVMSGEIALTWSGIASIQQQLDTNLLKPIAQAGNHRLPEYPNVPTFAELGYPEVDANVWVGLFAPAAMPAAVAAKIHEDVKTVLNTPDFKASHVTARGFEVRALGGKAFSDAIAAQLTSRAELVRLSGAKVE